MSDPEWLPRVAGTMRHDTGDLMRIAVEVAMASAKNGGGPFGALVTDREGRVVSLGWNAVLATRDSTAHAEIVAMRRAQGALGTHDLAGCALYTSCAPCIQCYGAIYWSGICDVYAAARKSDAEALGFQEGPYMDALWAHAREAKGIRFHADVGRDERALAVFAAYRAGGGRLY